MDKIQMIPFLIILCFYLYIPSKQAIHMLQQNRYQPRRYIVWLRLEVQRKYTQIFQLLLCFMGMYGLYFVSHEDIPSFLLMLLLLIYSYVIYKKEERTVYRKPLVFTKRVQRLCIAFYILHIGCLLLAVCNISLNTWIFILPFLYFIPWLTIVLVVLCMHPIEERIRQYYIHDAMKRLRQHQDLCCIGITGSYGKTSVKTILYHVLADTYYTLMTPHSYNNQMGITLTIRNHLQSLHEIFLCEMGADHIHEIEQLMEFVQPTIGIVSAVGPQHLQTFHTLGNILHEKMQMIERLPCNGIGIINIDNEYIRDYHIKNTCRIVTYGIHEEAQYQACNIHYSKEGTTFDIVHDHTSYAFCTKLLGEHNVLNITCAIALARLQQIEWQTLQRLIRSLDYVEHRLQLRETARYTILDNAYNSNPEGANYALDVLFQLEGKHIIVTPGFLDLGELSVRAHRRFGEQIASHVDVAVLVGAQQTKDIVVGLRAKGFPLSKLHVVNSIEEAFTIVEKESDSSTTVLLENDLPDAFNH